MQNVTVKAVMDFKHKGQMVKHGDTLSITPKLAGTYERLGWVKLNADAHAAVEKVEEKIVQSQSSDAPRLAEDRKSTPAKGKK